MTLDNDILKDLLQEQKRTSAIVAHYLENQRLEARRTPGIDRLTTYILQNPTSPPTALQIVPKSSERYKVGIANYGPGDCIISEKWFDPTTVLQWFSDPSDPDAILPGPNQAIEMGFLPTGNNVTVNGQSGVWAYNVQSASANCILSIMDSIYSRKQGAPNSQVAALHMPELHPFEAPGGQAFNNG